MIGLCEASAAFSRAAGQGSTLGDTAALRTSIFAVWIVFWIYWLGTAALAKPGFGTQRGIRARLAIIVIAVIVFRVIKPGSVTIHNPVLEAVGTVLFVAGIGFAVWARVHIGRNWGMPMSSKEDRELVTSGPYRFVRHPIYSGILLAVLGTSLATYISVLVVFAVMAAYFIYSATVEERMMATEFPTDYPSYRERTKMLIPLVL